MDKYILCLANSYKHGGRCIAGIEVEPNNDTLTIKRDEHGSPIWIRPVAHTSSGEIPLSEAQHVNVLSLVQVNDVVCTGHGSHAEDHYYSSMEVLWELGPYDQFLRPYIDTWHTDIFGNRSKSVSASEFQAGDYSLMLIRAEGAEVYIDNLYFKQRVKFSFHGNVYDFPITDPEFLERLKRDSSLYKTYDTLYVVASLGLVHEGKHFKLAATLIIPQL